MRAVDELDGPEPSPYLRRSKRVEIRRDRVRWKRILLRGSAIALLSAGVLGAAAYTIHTYLSTSPRFALRDTLAVGGGRHVFPDRAVRIFASNLGSSVFRVPLERRRAELMTLPWVESAHVIRGWPNRLRVLIEERKPMAFVRLSSGVSLIDREGVLLPLPAGEKFLFPVLSGITEAQPLEERKRRVGILAAVLQDLDREMPPRSGEVSEIDLTDPNDAAVTVTASGSAVMVHLGDSHFLERYKLFLENVEAWREQYGSVRSVDLRFEKQVIVKP